MTLLRRAIDMLTAPSAALAATRADGRAWFPLLTKLLIVTLFWVWYFRVVDFEWFKEQEIFASGEVPAEARATLEELLTPRFLAVSTLSTELAGMAGVVLGLSIYLWAFGRDRDGARLGLRPWLALVAWSGIPTILVWLAMTAIMTLRDRLVLPEQLDPTSLNSLVLELGPHHPWAGWAASLSLVHLWSAALLVLGVRQWTGASWRRATVLVAAPLLLLVGGWAAAIASA